MVESRNQHIRIREAGRSCEEPAGKTLQEKIFQCGYRRVTQFETHLARVSDQRQHR